METITMSSKEISRLEVMQKLQEKRLSQKEASTGVSVRHYHPTSRPTLVYYPDLVQIIVAELPGQGN